jgi:uncharacterized membrane protein required for colicin V production
MTYLNYLSLVLLLVCMGLGAWKGWTFQAYYMLMFIVLYIISQRINAGIFSFVLLPELSLETKKIVHLEGAFVCVFLVFYLVRKLHSYIFKQVEAVPGHRFIGSIFGFITGVLLILFLTSILNLTDYKSEKWWLDSIEYQLSVLSLQLIDQIYQ